MGEKKSHLYSGLVYSPNSHSYKEITLELPKDSAYKESLMNSIPKGTGTVEDNGVFHA